MKNMNFQDTENKSANKIDQSTNIWLVSVML